MKCERGGSQDDKLLRTVEPVQHPEGNIRPKIIAHFVGWALPTRNRWAVPTLQKLMFRYLT